VSCAAGVALRPAVTAAAVPPLEAASAAAPDAALGPHGDCCCVCACNSRANVSLECDEPHSPRSKRPKHASSNSLPAVMGRSIVLTVRSQWCRLLAGHLGTSADQTCYFDPRSGRATELQMAICKAEARWHLHFQTWCCIPHRHFTLALHPGSTDYELAPELDRLLPLTRPAGQGRQPKQH